MIASAQNWVILYNRVDHDAVVIGAVCAKKTDATPATVLAARRNRFRAYDDAVGEETN
ncbi:MAG: hypothetical protein MUE41_14615 [Gemmatimonadaceae bacterium]|nr:hypothetical protein [Gemmatimonadaceae bacterium]